jgi:hypothetical protein
LKEPTPIILAAGIQPAAQNAGSTCPSIVETDMSEGKHTAGQPLLNLARQFDLMSKGCRVHGLHGWEDHFFRLCDEARKGTIDLSEIAETIDYDYRNGQNGRATLDQILTALFADMRDKAANSVGAQ